jgi:hypothetical protein
MRPFVLLTMACASAAPVRVRVQPATLPSIPLTALPDDAVFRESDHGRTEIGPGGLACGPGKAGSTERRVLQPIALAPVRGGPRIADMPPLDAPRSVFIGGDGVDACYRWARIGARPAPATLAVSWHADPWGVVTTSVTAQAGATADLAACVSSVLDARPLRSFVPRVTEAELTIVIKPDADRWPVHAEPRPSLVVGDAVSGCAILPAELPVDDLRVGTLSIDAKLGPILKREDDERLHHRIAPTIHIGDAVPIAPDARAYAIVAGFDLGGFEACYADHPTDAGTITIDLVVEQTGRVRDARVDSSTAGDSALESCLRDETTALRYPPSQWQVELVVPFTLGPTPAPAAPPARRDDGCERYAQAFAELQVRAPWFDRRADALLRQVADDTACSHFVDEMQDTARVPFMIGLKFLDHGFLALAVARYRLMNAALGGSDPALRRDLAEILWKLAELTTDPIAQRELFLESNALDRSRL